MAALVKAISFIPFIRSPDNHLYPIFIVTTKPKPMSTYFIKNEAGQEGPFTLEELKTKGISAGTSILQEGTENWTTAGELAELKALFAAPEAGVPAAISETTIPAENEIKTTTAATATTATTLAATAATPAPPPASAPVATAGRKTGSAVIGWILSFAAIGGTGYYVYQDMEKNKDAAADVTTIQQTDSVATQDVTTNDHLDTTATITTEFPLTDTAAVVTSEPATTNVTPTSTLTTSTTTKDPVALKKAEEEKKKLLAAQAKKKEDEKKKLLLAEAKKKEAAAAAARETALRNNWARYVTVGSYKIEGDDKVKPFTIPVNNGYSVSLDKVTLRVDYLKKNKLVTTETLVLNNIGANNTQTVQAAGNKKGHTANVYITGINSSQLHLCYPVHNGNPNDPFYCK